MSLLSRIKSVFASIPFPWSNSSNASKEDETPLLPDYHADHRSLLALTDGIKKNVAANPILTSGPEVTQDITTLASAVTDIERLPIPQISPSQTFLKEFSADALRTFYILNVGLLNSVNDGDILFNNVLERPEFLIFFSKKDLHIILKRMNTAPSAYSSGKAVSVFQALHKQNSAYDEVDCQLIFSVTEKMKISENEMKGFVNKFFGPDYSDGKKEKLLMELLDRKINLPQYLFGLASSDIGPFRLALSNKKIIRKLRYNFFNFRILRFLYGASDEVVGMIYIASADQYFKKQNLDSLLTNLSASNQNFALLSTKQKERVLESLLKALKNNETFPDFSIKKCTSFFQSLSSEQRFNFWNKIIQDPSSPSIKGLMLSKCEGFLDILDNEEKERIFKYTLDYLFHAPFEFQWHLLNFLKQSEMLSSSDKDLLAHHFLKLLRQVPNEKYLLFLSFSILDFLLEEPKKESLDLIKTYFENDPKIFLDDDKKDTLLPFILSYPDLGMKWEVALYLISHSSELKDELIELINEEIVTHLKSLMDKVASLDEGMQLGYIDHIFVTSSEYPNLIRQIDISEIKRQFKFKNEKRTRTEYYEGTGRKTYTDEVAIIVGLKKNAKFDLTPYQSIIHSEAQSKTEEIIKSKNLHSKHKDIMGIASKAFAHPQKYFRFLK